jgi:hypothetical protein
MRRLSPRHGSSWLIALSCALICLSALPAPVEAQAAQPAAKKMMVGFGWSMDLIEPTRNGLDIVLSTAGARTGLVTSLRYGRYSPDGLLGSRQAEQEGFSPERRSDFASLFYGIQTPAPFLPVRLGFYGRVSGGLTMYLGQAFREAPPGQDPQLHQRQVGPRLAPGIEVAFGSRNLRSGPGLDFRSELRIGLEHVARAGFRMIRPTIVVGGDVPIRFR